MTRTRNLYLCLVSIALTGCGDFATEVTRLDGKLDLISRQLDELETPAANTVTSAEENSELSMKLADADAETRRRIVERNLEKSRSFVKLAVENLSAVTDSLKALNAVAMSSAVEAEELKQAARDEQERLVQLLESGLPALVQQLGQQALAETDYDAAQRIWLMGNTALRYYPKTDQPEQNAEFEQLSAKYQKTGQKVEMHQRQRYNRWACDRIKTATKQLESTSNDLQRQKISLHYVGVIEPTLLEPLSLSLYTAFFGELKKSVSIDTFFQVAENIAVQNRKSLSEI